MEAFRGMTGDGPFSLFFVAHKDGLPDKNFSISFGMAEDVLQAIDELKDWDWKILELRKDDSIITEEQLRQDLSM